MDAVYITELRARDIKRIEAFHIQPNEVGATVLSGPNGAGKSSGLDALWCLVGGDGAIGGDPINIDSETAEAEAVLTTGQRIKRTYKRDGSKKGYATKITLMNPDGTTVAQAQTAINKLVGSPIAFDPLDFSEMEPKKRRTLLAQLVGIDLDAFAARYKAVYDQRQAHSAVHRAAEGKLKDLVKPPETKGMALVDVAAVNEELAAALELQKRIDAGIHEAEAWVANAASSIKAYEAEMIGHRDRLEALKRQVADEEAWMATYFEHRPSLDKTAEDARLALEAAESQRQASPDIAAIQQRLAAADQQNAVIREAERQKAEYKRLHDDFKEQDAIREGYTTQLKAIEDERTAALAAAEYPVDGLSFGDDDILYNGLPFENASMGERLKLGIAVGSALLGPLKIIICKDASLMDQANRRLIHEEGAKAGVQLFLEVVADEKRDGEIFIVEGRVSE